MRPHSPSNMLALLMLCFLVVQEQPVLAADTSQETNGLTLQKALAEAYQKNPDLEAARAELKGVDETYAQAVAGFKPSVEGVADYTTRHRELATGTTNSDPKTLSLQVTQSLYSGGSTLAEVDQSINNIKAQRASLKIIEQQVLLHGVQVFMNLTRDQKIAQLELSNERVLKEHLKESRERFKVGDITKTDVSQAQSRLAGATASRVAAEGNFKKSRAFFEKVIGRLPQDLQTSELALILPATQEEALGLALKNNPAVALAQYTEEAAKASTRSIEGENLPQIELTGSVDKVYDPTTVSSRDENARTIGIRATLPFYTGGDTLSRTRQARQVENQRRMEVHSVERSVRQSVIEAWEGLAASEAQGKALQAQIEAAKLALEGVKVEASYGSRTTLDLLDAEQEYLNAQVADVGAEADRVIASYSLLAAVGGLTAEGLQLGVPVYDSVKNFQNLNANVFSWPFHKDK